MGFQACLCTAEFVNDQSRHDAPCGRFKRVSARLNSSIKVNATGEVFPFQTCLCTAEFVNGKSWCSPPSGWFQACLCTAEFVNNYPDSCPGKGFQACLCTAEFVNRSRS